MRQINDLTLHSVEPTTDPDAPGYVVLGEQPSDNADALIRAAVTPEARRVIRADVIAEIVAALRAEPGARPDGPYFIAADFIEQEFGQ